MEGLLFLGECIGIGLILLWIVQNDAAGPGEPTRGLFAMRSGVLQRKIKAGPRPWVRPIHGQRELPKHR